MKTFSRRSIAVLTLALMLPTLMLAINIPRVSAYTYSPLLSKISQSVFKIDPLGQFSPDQIDKDTVVFTVQKVGQPDKTIAIRQIITKQDIVLLILDITSFREVGYEPDGSLVTGNLLSGADFGATGPAPAWRMRW